MHLLSLAKEASKADSAANGISCSNFEAIRTRSLGVGSYLSLECPSEGYESLLFPC